MRIKINANVKIFINLNIIRTSKNIFKVIQYLERVGCTHILPLYCEVKKLFSIDSKIVKHKQIKNK